MMKDNGNPKTYQLHPIGTVQASDEDGSYILLIDKPYRAGLKELDQFSHVMVFWWADQMDSEKYRDILTTELPYAPAARNTVPIPSQ